MSIRTAFVTGGAQGIGKGIATTLGVQGFAVAVVDLNLDAARATAAAITPDVAAAVAFFASEAAGYVTGQTLSVSGGLTMA